MIYGRTLHCYTFISGLLNRGVPPDRITLAIPPRDENTGELTEFNTNEEKLWFSHYLFREVNSNDGKNLWTTWWVLTLILNRGLSINPSKNLVFHDGYNFEDSPEHFNRKAFIKKKFKIQKIEVKNLQKKPIKYSQFFDNEHFKIIKKIDPHFEILNLLKWKFKMLLRNSLYKKNFQSAKIKL